MQGTLMMNYHPDRITINKNKKKTIAPQKAFCSMTFV